MIEPLLLNLGARDVISPDEEQALRAAIVRQRKFATEEDLVVEGERPNSSTLILSGFAARYRVLEDGKRQITALHVAGDFVDLHAFPLKTMDHSVVALSTCQVAYADHADIRALTETRPHLTRLLWLSTVIDGAIHREWIVAMGRRSKKAHLAHLICELYMRLSVVRLVTDQSFYFPLSQAVVADALGLSVVHVNKTLQKLRSDNVVTWTDRTITVLNWEKLTEIAQFDPTYLHLSMEPR
ncbi:Crp/Fnr family transcriptional regulator [Rhizobium sp. RU36D]|uniref:Crp/Fnr family transcriptional regulator n=1 Tax=Rhizobium sp. RU36D TaxID=1907415 RepID=UPI0009D8609F|nr:Crp/Fnr family transcriptional regulator [Rhizobium sp. RU36D]SMC39213.1 cAMP-binding domain of CRP or a regulatory subunit of cAMP-dependent protein kinases [Rhizobium sp. RU36D]